MDDLPPNPVGKEHFLAFGAIVQHFASFERLVEVCIARILGANHAMMAMTISGLGYTAKCEALTSLVQAVSIPQEQGDAILKALADFNQRTPLRNAIAHQKWREGARPGSIRPLSITSRGGKAKVRGVLDTDQDYTEDELIDIADDLCIQHDAFVSYLVAIGFIRKAEEIIAEMRLHSPSLPGHPSKPSK